MQPRRAILVVEDDLEIRETLVEILGDQGFSVLAAENGAQALDLLRRREELPCLILLDVMMPVMDGRSFRQEQQRDPRLAPIPVVVISAYRDVEETAQQMGVDEFLRKPLRRVDLLAVAARYCA